jgi:DNA-directed RNA polymerase subunit E'/Rpb7
MGADAIYDVVFRCEACYPVEGAIIDCVVKNITKAGIRAETTLVPNPAVIYVAKDHHYSDQYFSSIKEGQHIKVQVIGVRFKLKDENVSVIASLVNDTKDI